MPTHTYMSPEPPARGVFAAAQGIRAARIAEAEPRSLRTPLPQRTLLAYAELALMAFTAGAGFWCLYEGVRLVTS
jgi:hypothetical protein